MSTTAQDARRWPAPQGVRARSALAAVLVVALALGLGAGLFLQILQRDLVDAAQRSAESRAKEVVGQLRRDGLADLDDELHQGAREAQVVQVLDVSGQVISASSPRAHAGPLSDLRPRDGQIRKHRVSLAPLLDDDDPYLVLVAAIRVDHVPYRVVVATSIANEQQSVASALKLLLVGLPLLLLLVAVATWQLVGRALAPVERMRARASQIGGARVGDVSDRIPVPQSGDEIARLAVTLNQMLSRLQLAQENQRRFVAAASHELRSPLSTLRAALEVALRDDHGSTWQELAPVMSAETTRMGRLVEDLLLLSKVDEHSIVLTTSEVDLDDLLDEQARRLRAHPNLAVRLDVLPVQVRGDHARLSQAVANVVDNAAQHAQHEVVLTLRPEGSGAVITVDDDGTGVPEADRSRVLQRFVRLDDSRSRDSGGSGLGLAIVDEIVRAHHGQVVVSASPAGGCRIQLTLPRPSP